MRSPPSPWGLLGAAVVAQIGISVIDQGLPTLTGFLKADLHLSAGAAGFAVSTFVLGRIFASYGAGVATDRLGERRVLVAGTVVSGGLCVLAAAAGVPLLFVLITFAGSASAVATPAGGRLVLAAFPRSRHGLALGIRQTGIPIGGLIGAAVLPWVAHLWGWRWSLVVAGLAAALSAIPLAARREGSADEGPRSRPVRGPAPWRDRNIRLLTMWASLFASGQYALLAFLALDLRERDGFALTTGSLFVAVAQLGGLGARIAWGATSDRFSAHGRKPLLLAVNGCAVAGIVALAALPSSAPTLVLVGVILLAGLGAMGFQGLFMLVLAEAAGPGSVGAATGFAVTGMQLATVAGIPLYGFVADTVGSYRAVWATLAAVLLVAFIPALLVRE